LMRDSLCLEWVNPTWIILRAYVQQ
ncbi:MAG: hypothetical protein RL064_333, partial [Bacteroidota bacterium]